MLWKLKWTVFLNRFLLLFFGEENKISNDKINKKVLISGSWRPLLVQVGPEVIIEVIMLTAGAKDFVKWDEDNLTVPLRLLKHKTEWRKGKNTKWNLVVAGYKPRHKEQQWGGATRPRSVVESRPQNQDPAGAGGQHQPVQSPLCNTDQVFQTGTTGSIKSHSAVLIRRSEGVFGEKQLWKCWKGGWEVLFAPLRVQFDKEAPYFT